MKKLLLLSLAIITSGATFAQEVGRVISATPVIQRVGVPRQVCSAEQVAVQQPKSGAGALMGAIAGAATRMSGFDVDAPRAKPCYTTSESLSA